MPEHFYREILLKGGANKRYRLTVEFKEPSFAPLGLFLNAEAGSFYAELKDILAEVKDEQKPLEFSGNLAAALIGLEKTIVTAPGPLEEDVKSCEIPTADFAALLDEYHAKAVTKARGNVPAAQIVQ